METKEAIKFLEECQDEITDLQEKGHDELLIKVIALLKRGEKFEKIYEELIEEYGEYVIRMNYENKPLCVRMDKIKQKYFPKED